MAGQTFTWIGGSGSGDVPSNWNPLGPPNSGDTSIVDSGTVQLVDAELTSNTVLLNAGTFRLTNDTGSFGSNGSLVSVFDQDTTTHRRRFEPVWASSTCQADACLLANRTESSLPAGCTTLFAGASGPAEIDTFGDFVNEGLIEAAGAAHTSTTINIAQSGTAPGYSINYGEIEAAVGNAVTINVVGTSELFNANLIYANGGTVVINGGTGIAGGYAPMLGGIALIGDGGTLELNAGFPSRTKGSALTFRRSSDCPGPVT